MNATHLARRTPTFQSLFYVAIQYPMETESSLRFVRYSKGNVEEAEELHSYGLS